MVKKRYLLRIVLISVLNIFLQNHSSAQPAPDDPDQIGADDPGDPGDPDPDLPIDTNILLLVGAGVLYGLKKAWDAKQKLKSKKGSLQTTANYHDFIK